MISIVIPVYNERENIRSLLEELTQAAETVPISEIIYVDDASNDGTFNILKEVLPDFPLLRALQHRKNSGQSAALWTGIKAASNSVIVTLDGDGQNDPKDIKKLYDMHIRYAEKMPRSMVIGEREKRQDSWIKRVSSRFANAVRSWALSDHTKDTGCSLKLFKRSDYLNLPYFDHMHRYLPALMMRDGVHVMHAGVSHRPRTAGVSKYGTLDRLFAGIYDLLGVVWLLKRGDRQFDTHEELGALVSISNQKESDNVRTANFS
jgi:dolichol-phosphate mannosyltransferase